MSTEVAAVAATSQGASVPPQGMRKNGLFYYFFIPQTLVLIIAQASNGTNRKPLSDPRRGTLHMRSVRQSGQPWQL